MLHLFFLSLIAQESNSAWVLKASNPQHKSISYADRSLRCIRCRANIEPTVQSNLEHTKGKMSEMQITLENFTSFQCYLKSTMIDWNFSLELISTQIGPSIQCYFYSIQNGGCDVFFKLILDLLFCEY